MHHNSTELNDATSLMDSTVVMTRQANEIDHDMLDEGAHYGVLAENGCNTFANAMRFENWPALKIRMDHKADFAANLSTFVFGAVISFSCAYREGILGEHEWQHWSTRILSRRHMSHRETWHRP